MNLDVQAVAVPQLIIAGGADNGCGTARPYLYFRRYRDLGAPWAFVVRRESLAQVVTVVKAFLRMSGVSQSK